MNWNRARAWLGTLVRLVLGVVWIWAAWSKLQSPRTFLQAVRAYDATPEWLSRAIGYGLPVLEICLGVLLVLGVVVRLAAAVSVALFVVFLVGMSQAAARGIQLECGCFGGGGASTSTHYALDILRDIGLLVLAAYLLVWSVTRISLDEYLARHDHVAMPSAKRMRAPEGRRKYTAMVEKRRRAARDRTLYLGGSLAVVVVLVSVIGIGVQAGRAKIQGSLLATHATVTDGVVDGKKAAATVDLFEDFQCPNCLDFEQTAGAKLDADVKANLAQLRFHPIAILDASSNGNRYSSRAANAALCASDVSVDFFVAYHNVLYGKDRSGQRVQPGEGSNGRSDAELIGYASLAGIPAGQTTSFGTCVQTEQHKALVQAMTDDASKRGITGTPTVIVNGTKLGSNDLKTVQAAIAKADAAGPAPQPSPSASSASPKPSAKQSSAPKPSTKPSTSKVP